MPNKSPFPEDALEKKPTLGSSDGTDYRSQVSGVRALR